MRPHVAPRVEHRGRHHQRANPALVHAQCAGHAVRVALGRAEMRQPADAVRRGRDEVKRQHALRDRRVFGAQVRPPAQQPLARHRLHPEAGGRDRVFLRGRHGIVRDREERDEPVGDALDAGVGVEGPARQHVTALVQPEPQRAAREELDDIARGRLVWRRCGLWRSVCAARGPASAIRSAAAASAVTSPDPSRTTGRGGCCRR